MGYARVSTGHQSLAAQRDGLPTASGSSVSWSVKDRSRSLPATGCCNALVPRGCGDRRIMRHQLDQIIRVVRGVLFVTGNCSAD